MKKIANILLSLIFSTSLWAMEENAVADSLSTDSSSLSIPTPIPTLQVWTVDQTLGTRIESDLDTTFFRFHVNNPALKKTVALEYLGNYYTPAQSAIFAERTNKTQFLFFQPYQIYYKSPAEVQHFNTKTPFTNINFNSGGNSNRDNRHIDGVFTLNVNKKINLGMYGDWSKSYGCYTSLSTKNYNAGFFGSYLTDRNQLTANVSFNGYESYVNGGFTDDRYITDPKNTGKTEPASIPVFITSDAWNKLRNWNAFVNYKHNFGFEKEVEVSEDSTRYDFVPVASLIYTFSSESDWHRFYERGMMSGGIPIDSFYHAYHLNDALNYDSLSSNDSTRFWQMRHIIGVSLNEEYNTLMRFGLSAYIATDIKKYTYLDEELSRASGAVSEENEKRGYLINPRYNTRYRSKMGVGARLSKHIGKAFTYDLHGEYYFVDEKGKAGTVDFGGVLQSAANWGKQPVKIGAEVNFERYCPDFLEEHYFGNHIKWDNDFDYKDVFRTSGYLSFPSFAFYKDLGITLSADFCNLHNYIYWNQKALPQQYGQSVQVLTLSAKENARLWVFHWDNEVVFQQSGNAEVLPLPQLSCYSLFYLQINKLFKVLSFQLGLDLRWNSAYYAPCYMPSTGQFYQQNPENENYRKYGNYPYMNAFLNISLKRARAFLQYNHISQNWFNNYDYMILPGYAVDPSYLKFGISINLAK